MSGPAALSILPVRDRRDLKQFLQVTREVYRDDPHWVQPLDLERLDHLNREKNPALGAITWAAWTALRGPRPVGRITAQINRAHLERYDDATGQFGFFETIDDPEIAAVLLETAEIWLSARGMKRVRGPFSLSINDECGLLLDGFDTPPMMMMPHGRPYYAGMLAEAGYAKAVDLLAYRLDVAEEWPAAARHAIARATTMPELVVRPIDMRRYTDEIRLICDIFNDAWAGNWGFVPFTADEAHYLAKSIRPLVTPDLAVIGELSGEPAAMAVSLPNLNEAIRDLDGRLLPTGWTKLLWRLKVGGLRSARMPLMGVRRRFQRTRWGAALAMGVIHHTKQAGMRRGIRLGEMSWVLEENARVRRIIESIGGEAYKTYRIFAKDLV